MKKDFRLTLKKLLARVLVNFFIVYLQDLSFFVFVSVDDYTYQQFLLNARRSIFLIDYYNLACFPIGCHWIDIFFLGDIHHHHNCAEH